MTVALEAIVRGAERVVRLQRLLGASRYYAALTRLDNLVQARCPNRICSWRGLAWSVRAAPLWKAAHMFFQGWGWSTLWSPFGAHLSVPGLFAGTWGHCPVTLQCSPFGAGSTFAAAVLRAFQPHLQADTVSDLLPVWD